MYLTICIPSFINTNVYLCIHANVICIHVYLICIHAYTCIHLYLIYIHTLVSADAPALASSPTEGDEFLVDKVSTPSSTNSSSPSPSPSVNANHSNVSTITMLFLMLSGMWVCLTLLLTFLFIIRLPSLISRQLSHENSISYCETGSQLQLDKDLLSVKISICPEEENWIALEMATYYIFIF